MTISDAPSCGVTYDSNSDNFKGVIYDCNIFIIPATADKVKKNLACEPSHGKKDFQSKQRSL